jgi:hypothetical protein
MTKIIGFSGKKQSGKSSCANFLYANFLANTNAFTKVIMNNFGQIEVIKPDNSQHIVDVFDYYHLRPNIDTYILDVIQKLSGSIKVYSFADILKKQICIDILGLTYEQCYGTDEQKNTTTDMSLDGQSLTAREVMQIVGTDFFRKIKVDIWPESTIRKILIDQPQSALINDCRFPNEVAAIKNHNGCVIRLTRNIYGDDSSHESENILNQDRYDWNNFNYILDNSNLDILQQSEQLFPIFIENIK